MSQILFVHSSARGASSISHELADHFKGAVVEKGHSIAELDLGATPLPLLDEVALGAFFSAPAQHTPEQADVFEISESLIEALFAADTLVISAGMYNFTVPATLKAYIDLIARAGRTFRYTEGGPEGLLKGKKAVLILTSGGIYSNGPAVGMDFLAPYLKTVLGFIGITDVEIVRAEGLALGAEVAATALAKAKEQLSTLA